jgi:protein-disulfide isomerase/uncharacterized membrane protein
MHQSPTRHRVAFALSLLGAAVSTLAVIIHQRLTAGSGYTSFCNLGGVINCDVVMGSRYGLLLGVPVASWGLAAFGLGAVLAAPGAFKRARRGLADLLLVTLVSGSFGYALVLAVVSPLFLHHLCLICLTMQALVTAWFLTVLPLATRFEGPLRFASRRTAISLVVVASLVAVVGGTFAVTRITTEPSLVTDVQSRDPKFYSWYTSLPIRPMDQLISPTSHSNGPSTAPITIVEFSDFQCPFCAQAFRDLHELLASRKDVRLIFRHFPLDSACNSYLRRSMHPDACAAAIAAECAGRQDRFWEYHDLLFRNHDHLDRPNLVGYARELGINLDTFIACLDDPAVRTTVSEDVEAGARAGISSTPTLFINGRVIEGALDRTRYEYALIIEGQERVRVHDKRS